MDSYRTLIAYYNVLNEGFDITLYDYIEKRVGMVSIVKRLIINNKNGRE
jgi:hypothetical protein